MYKFNFLRKFNFLFFIFSIVIFSEEASLNFGGKDGWNNLVYSSNLIVQKGKFGNESLRLTSSNFNKTDKTDAYISFDSEKPFEETGNYNLVEYSTLKTGNKMAKYGEGAGFFSYHLEKASLRLKPNQKAFFYGNSVIGSFTIEFWLYPQMTQNGSTIFKWWSSLIKNKKTMYQNIIASITNNKLEWSFLNIWLDNSKGLDIKLAGKSNLIPEKWSHHLITYDENTGLLEYRMNGRTEDILYLTKTRHESSQILESILGASSDIFIGLNYSGLIDEFKIRKQFSEPNMPWENSALFEKYSLDGGRLETNIIEVGGKTSEAKFLESSFIKPNQTDIEFFIRAADSPFNWTEKNPEWKPISLDKKIKGVKGKFFQIACNIYPDAYGKQSPILNSFSLKYEKDNLPLPPAKILAKAKNGSVKLSWSPSVNFDIKGYFVFFGEKKGEYFDENSPVDVGNVLEYSIDNLKNGKIYFFAVAAYDDEKEKNLGTFSKEVWARPLKSKEN